MKGRLLSQGPTKFDPVRIAERVATKQRREDAERMASTLVNDIDGHWLEQTLKQVRRGPATLPSSKSGVQSDRERVFHFRSSQFVNNLTGADSEQYYRTVVMPEGFRVFKVSGNGYRSWLLRVDNGHEGIEHVYIDLRYNDDHILVLSRLVSAAHNLRSGRRAGARLRGCGPNRSVG